MTRILLLPSMLLAFLSCPVAAQDNPANMFDGNVILPTAGELQVWRARGAGPAPIVIFLQDRAWPRDNDCGIGPLFSDLNEAGISVVNFIWRTRRLRDAVRELERFLRLVRRDARWLEMDASRVAVAGCGSGAHFAALIGSDPSLLERAGLGFAALRGVAVVNSDGIDLERLMADVQARGDTRLARRIQSYLGEDGQYVHRMSPLAHVAPPNAPAFLFIEPSQSPPAPSDILASSLAADSGVDIQHYPISAFPARQSREARTRLEDEVSQALVEFLVPLLAPARPPPARF